MFKLRMSEHNVIKKPFIIKYLTLCLSILSVTNCIIYGQQEIISKNWKTETLMVNGFGEINYHIHKNKIKEPKPLIVYLQGSTNFPLYYLNPNGGYSTGITLNATTMSENFHIILISKPETPLFDSIQIAPSGRKQYPLKRGYIEKYSLDWRVTSADKVIDDALKKSQ